MLGAAVAELENAGAERSVSVQAERLRTMGRLKMNDHRVMNQSSPICAGEEKYAAILRRMT